MIIVVIFALVSSLVIAMVSPFGGLLALLAVNAIQPGELYPSLSVIHPERVLALFLFFSMLVRSPHLRFPVLTRYVLAFWAVMIVSVPTSIWISSCFLFVLDFGRTVLYNVMLVNLVTTLRRFRLLLLTFVLLMGWFAGSSLWAYAHGEFQVRNSYGAGALERAVGLTSSSNDPNSLGITLVSGLPIILLFVSDGDWKHRFLGLAVAVMSVWAVLLTGSRTAVMCLAAFFGLWAVTRRKALLYIPAVVLILILAWTLLPQQYQQRYLSVESRDQDESYTNRIVAWHAGWHMFLDHPVLGVGAGQFGIADGMKYWSGNTSYRMWLQPHSLYVQVIAELGCAGTIAFGLLLFQTFAHGRRLKRQLRMTNAPGYLKGFPSAAAFSLLILMMAGYASHSLYRWTWYFIAGLVAAADFVAQHEIEGAEPVLSEAEETLAIPEPVAATHALVGGLDYRG